MKTTCNPRTLAKLSQYTQKASCLILCAGASSSYAVEQSAQEQSLQSSNTALPTQTITITTTSTAAEYGGIVPSGTSKAHEGNVDITMNSGSREIIIGGNYGNAEGSSFQGDTSITINAGKVMTVIGAGYINTDTTSSFTGNTTINIHSNLSYSSIENIITDDTGSVVGGFYGSATNNTATEKQPNTLHGDTFVNIDLGNPSSTQDFIYNIIGGSSLQGAVETVITGTTHVNISNADNVEFQGYVIGADTSYSKESGAMNSGDNKSASSVAHSKVTLEGGRYYAEVMGGGFSAGGGDIHVGSITMELTDTRHYKAIIGASTVGVTEKSSLFEGPTIIDASAGNITAGDVTMTLSNVHSSDKIIGGHYISQQTTSDSTDHPSVGNISIDVSNLDYIDAYTSNTIKNIYGGSYLESNYATQLQQGSIEVQLTTGLITLDVVAAGYLSTGINTAITTSSTSVIVSDQMHFSGVNGNGHPSLIIGGYQSFNDNASAVTGEKLLSFNSTNSTYDRLATNFINSSRTEENPRFLDFDTVEVADGSSVTLDEQNSLTYLTTTYYENLMNNSNWDSVVNDRELQDIEATRTLTKTGAGELTVNAGVTQDKVYDSDNVLIQGAVSSRSDVKVEQGTLHIKSPNANSTVGTISVSAGATVSTEDLTIEKGAVTASGLSANDATGAGTLLSSNITVNQEWNQQSLQVVVEGTLSMKTGEDVRLKSLDTQRLEMSATSHLSLAETLRVSSVDIGDQLESGASVSAPFITAQALLSDDSATFTFNFSQEVIESMDLGSKGYHHVAMLDEKAVGDFVFQIEGAGGESSQVIDGITYYLGTSPDAARQTDIYIYRSGTTIPDTDIIPEPSTATLSLLALSGLLARRRRAYYFGKR